MASKQLGKLRQWAGEVISSKEKTVPPEDFIQLEKEVDLTRRNLETLHLASLDYHAYVSRKVVSEAVKGEDKLTHSEALGIVMTSYGEELGEESDFGRSLSSYGRARSRIAALQETFAVHIMEAFVAHLNRSLVELEEYSGLRKKLESRRLALDAAIAKTEKSFKKEKDKKEAYDELEKARLRYDKVCDDVQVRMNTIRLNEDIHKGELSDLLESETKFIEDYLSVLRDVRAEWPEENDTRKTPRASSFRQTSASNRNYEPKSTSSRFSSYRSDKVNGSRRSLAGDWQSSDSEGEKPTTRPPSQLSRKKSGTIEAPSRPQSRQSRKRHDSTATAASVMTDDPDVVKAPKPRRKSVVSSFGDAVSSVMSRSKVKDKENFSALQDDDAEIERPRSAMSNRSGKSGKSYTGSEKAKTTPKKMRALYDFSGSTDELSFKVGDEINVIQEVLDDWWMGEVNGKKGLFPSTYAVIITDENRKPQTVKPPRTTSSSNLFGSISRAVGTTLSSETDESKKTLVNGTESEFSSDEDSDNDSLVHSKLFDDHHRVEHHHHDYDDIGHVVTSSDTILPSTKSSLGTPGKDSRDMSDHHSKLSAALLAQAMTAQISNDDSNTTAPSPTKRMPPPPPPRRTPTNGSLAPPPLPARNMSSRSHSTTSLLTPMQPTLPDAWSRKANSDTSSPFDSENQSLNSFDAVALTNSGAKCRACGCLEFHNDPFRGNSICTNCGHPYEG